MKPISAIINARIQSSRLERKMIRPYAGTTLLDIALDKLNRLDYFDHRYLAVAEPELKEMARRYPNVEVLERTPESVAPGPHPPLVTFEHYLRIPTRYLLVINACASFLSLETIRRAYDFFQAADHPAYISVAPTRDWIFTAEGVALTHKNPRALQNTSHGEVFYRATHSFYIMDCQRFREEDGLLWNLVPGDPALIPMPPEEAVDVDTPLEFEIANLLFQRKAERAS